MKIHNTNIFISQTQVTRDMLHVHIHIHKQKRQSGQTAQQLRALIVLIADLGWVSSPLTVPQSLVTPGLGSLTPSSGLLGHSVQVVYTHTCRQTHKNKYFFLKKIVRSGMGAQSFNPSTWDWGTSGALCLEPNLVDIVNSKLVMMRPCLKEKQNHFTWQMILEKYLCIKDVSLHAWWWWFL